MIFDHFIHKSLPKNLKLQKYPKLWGFLQKYKIFRYTTLGQKHFFNFQILFLTTFCNLKRYFRVFWPFYTQILTKKPKIQKRSKTMRFLTKLQNHSIYNLDLTKTLKSTKSLIYRIYYMWFHFILSYLIIYKVKKKEKKKKRR